MREVHFKITPKLVGLQADYAKNRQSRVDEFSMDLQRVTTKEFLFSDYAEAKLIRISLGWFKKPIWVIKNGTDPLTVEVTDKGITALMDAYAKDGMTLLEFEQRASQGGSASKAKVELGRLRALYVKRHMSPEQQDKLISYFSPSAGIPNCLISIYSIPASIGLFYNATVMASSRVLRRLDNGHYLYVTQELSRLTEFEPPKETRAYRLTEISGELDQAGALVGEPLILVSFKADAALINQYKKMEGSDPTKGWAANPVEDKDSFEWPVKVEEINAGNAAVTEQDRRRALVGFAKLEMPAFDAAPSKTINPIIRSAQASRFQWIRENKRAIIASVLLIALCLAVTALVLLTAGVGLIPALIPPFLPAAASFTLGSSLVFGPIFFSAMIELVLGLALAFALPAIYYKFSTPKISAVPVANPDHGTKAAKASSTQPSHRLDVSLAQSASSTSLSSEEQAGPESRQAVSALPLAMGAASALPGLRTFHEEHDRGLEALMPSLRQPRGSAALDAGPPSAAGSAIAAAVMPAPDSVPAVAVVMPAPDPVPAVAVVMPAPDSVPAVAVVMPASDSAPAAAIEASALSRTARADSTDSMVSWVSAYSSVPNDELKGGSGSSSLAPDDELREGDSGSPRARN